MLLVSSGFFSPSLVLNDYGCLSFPSHSINGDDGGVGSAGEETQAQMAIWTGVSKLEIWIFFLRHLPAAVVESRGGIGNETSEESLNPILLHLSRRLEPRLHP